jgi:serine/threonine protein phosphatase PrpC
MRLKPDLAMDPALPDGLNTMLTDDQIHELLRITATTRGACRETRRAANRQGGEDNVTVVVVRCDDAACDAASAVPR